MQTATRQLAAAMVIVLFAAGCSTTPETANQAGQTNAAAGEETICDTDTDIGSHIAKKTCVSASVAEQRKALAQEYLEKNQQAAMPAR
jgi:hypothetical protein